MIYHILVNICCFYHWNSFALFCPVDLVDSVGSVFAAPAAAVIVVVAAAAALGAAFIVVAAIVANTNASVVTYILLAQRSVYYWLHLY